MIFLSTSNHYVEIKASLLPPDFKLELDKSDILAKEVCAYLNRTAHALASATDFEIPKKLVEKFKALVSESHSSSDLYEISGLVMNKHSSLDFSFHLTDSEDGTNVKYLSLNLSRENLEKLGVKLNCLGNYDDFLENSSKVLEKGINTIAIKTVSYDHAYLDSDVEISIALEDFNPRDLTINYIETRFLDVIESVEYCGCDFYWEVLDKSAGSITEYHVIEEVVD